MAHNETVGVQHFIGKSRELVDAMARARDYLNAWYATQEILFTQDMSSIFQFSTTAYIYDGEHVFIITVFDTRRRDNRR